MKKAIGLLLIMGASYVHAQSTESNNSANYNSGEGFTFNLNNGDFQFTLGGFIQPNLILENDEDDNFNSRWNVRRSFFMMSGKAVKQKVSFSIQTDFSARSPLLDAWIAYQPYTWLTITGGQKQNLANNREMLFREDRLQFTDRSLGSQTFSRSGREFGLFLETKFGKTFGLAPQFSVTSGDGKNSFGADSRDTDLGGLKFGGRLDLYPLGFFKEGNDLYTADLLREDKAKFVLGAAASKNYGASNAVGEGHGDFLLYDQMANVVLPNYSKIHADVLMKFKGFSMLLEYTNATASGIDVIFTDENASTILAPSEISEYLILGNAFTAQLGYVTKKGYSLDIRYENVAPEFGQNNGSLLRKFDSYTLGLSKYFESHNLKIQIALTQTNFAQNTRIMSGNLLLQIAF